MKAIAGNWRAGRSGVNLLLTLIREIVATGRPLAGPRGIGAMEQDFIKVVGRGARAADESNSSSAADMLVATCLAAAAQGDVTA
jgi:hypothetical protein